jgi:hypothetical protein
MKLHAKTLFSKTAPVQFTQLSGPDQAKGVNEESLPWAEILESRPAGFSSSAEKLNRVVFGAGYLPVPVMLSVITLVAILLYFLAQ